MRNLGLKLRILGGCREFASVVATSEAGTALKLNPPSTLWYHCMVSLPVGFAFVAGLRRQDSPRELLVLMGLLIGHASNGSHSVTCIGIELCSLKRP